MVLGSMVKTPLNYPRPDKIFEKSFLPPWELTMTPHYLSRFSNFDVKRLCDCLRAL